MKTTCKTIFFAFVAVLMLYNVSHAYTETAKKILALAQKGNAKAQHQFGELCRFGKEDVPENFYIAVFWFEKAANQGLVEAQKDLGIMLAEGRGVDKNYEKAIYWFDQAAMQGDNFSKEYAKRLKDETNRSKMKHAVRYNTSEDSKNANIAKSDQSKTIDPIAVVFLLSALTLSFAVWKLSLKRMYTRDPNAFCAEDELFNRDQITNNHIDKTLNNGKAKCENSHKFERKTQNKNKEDSNNFVNTNEAYWRAEEAKWQAEAERAERKAEEAKKNADNKKLKREKKQTIENEKQKQDPHNQEFDNDDQAEDKSALDILNSILKSFDELDLPYTASFEEIKRKHSFLVQFYRSNNCRDISEAEEYTKSKIKKINDAYAILKEIFDNGLINIYRTLFSSKMNS